MLLTQKNHVTCRTTVSINVPILQVIEKLVLHRDVYRDTCQQFVNATSNCLLIEESDCLESVTDGEIYRNDRLFADNPNALTIRLYVYEVELRNPISAKKGQHEITAVFHVVGNLHAT